MTTKTKLAMGCLSWAIEEGQELNEDMIWGMAVGGSAVIGLVVDALNELDGQSSDVILSRLNDLMGGASEACGFTGLSSAIKALEPYNTGE